MLADFKWEGGCICILPHYTGDSLISACIGTISKFNEYSPAAVLRIELLIK